MGRWGARQGRRYALGVVPQVHAVLRERLRDGRALRVIVGQCVLSQDGGVGLPDLAGEGVLKIVTFVKQAGQAREYRADVGRHSLGPFGVAHGVAGVIVVAGKPRFLFVADSAPGV